MRRVVITGLGLVTPLGSGVDATWSRLTAGQSGARRIEEFEINDISCQIACFVPRGSQSEGKFNPDDWMELKTLGLKTKRTTQDLVEGWIKAGLAQAADRA